MDGQSKTPSIITEYVNNTDFKVLYPRLTDFDVRYYVFELLKVRGVNSIFPFRPPQWGSGVVRVGL